MFNKKNMNTYEEGVEGGKIKEKENKSKKSKDKINKE